MTISLDRIFAAGGFTGDDVILYAYLCSNADKKDDPIGRAIVGAFKGSSVKSREAEYTQKEIIGFNPTVKRIVAFVDTMARLSQSPRVSPLSASTLPREGLTIMSCSGRSIC